MNFFKLFRKNPRPFFLDFSPLHSTWQAVSWNFDLPNPGARVWALEVHKDEKQSMEWLKNDVERVRFFKNKKLIFDGKIINERSDFQELMNLCIHSTLKYGLESHHDFLRAPVSGATSADYQSETRALQWLQASFGTLHRSLDQFKNRPDLILTAAIFSGIGPDSKVKVLRVLIFNIDIFCYFQEDLSLQIVVFDDKNLGHGQSKSPSLQEIIKVTKPQIYDEIVKLVHKIAKVGEVS